MVDVNINDLKRKRIVLVNVARVKEVRLNHLRESISILEKLIEGLEMHKDKPNDEEEEKVNE